MSTEKLNIFLPGRFSPAVAQESRVSMSIMATSIGDEIASSAERTTWFTGSLAVTLDPRVFAGSLSEETNRISDRIVFQKRIALNRQVQNTANQDF